MRICRFHTQDNSLPSIGYLDDSDQVIDLTFFQITQMKSLFDAEKRALILAQLQNPDIPKLPLQLALSPQNGGM